MWPVQGINVAGSTFGKSICDQLLCFGCVQRGHKCGRCGKSICDPILGFGWVEAPPNTLRAEQVIAVIFGVIVHEIAHRLVIKFEGSQLRGRRGITVKWSNVSASECELPDTGQETATDADY